MKKTLKLPDDFLNALSNEQKFKIKAIEDRIEQKWKTLDIILSLNVINGIAGPVTPPPMPERSKELLEDIEENIKKLSQALGIGKTEEISQLDIDRKNIWDAVNRYGIAVVLTFIDSQIVTNIEKFFAGLVVAYITMFNSGQRAQLPANKIFAGDADLQALHKRFYDLRDEWYAHVGRNDGRHNLKYRIDESGKIFIDKSGEQITPEYHLSEFSNLFKCAIRVSSFIETDIDERVSDIMSSLDGNQKDILSEHWSRENQKRIE
ncbi:hypothetical protein [Azospirillum sp. TSA6c]|uniref:hypothetical protein n=1 Tax=unclassified Azospirillum TaxID=2630922 RepID=UPI0011B37EB3|nr:hypothetical protein [Azospirillum sp. TSA6c]